MTVAYIHLYRAQKSAGYTDKLNISSLSIFVNVLHWFKLAQLVSSCFLVWFNDGLNATNDSFPLSGTVQYSTIQYGLP